SRRPNQGPCARPPLPAKPLAECTFGAEIAFTSAYPDKSSEPPVRIELTTGRLQGECSTTELRRPGKSAASLTGHWSLSMMRVERTDRDDGRRRPGSGMRSAMLLNGLTTMVSAMTA